MLLITLISLLDKNMPIRIIGFCNGDSKILFEGLVKDFSSPSYILFLSVYQILHNGTRLLIKVKY